MFNEAEKIIKARLKDQWTETEIDLDNVGFDPVMGTSFIRLQIDWTSVVRRSISNRALKGDGYTLISIFTPQNTGSARAFVYADSLVKIFNNYKEGSLKFKIGRPVRVGDNKGWFQVNIIHPFHYDECN